MIKKVVTMGLLLSLWGQAQAETLTVVSYGGIHIPLQTQAFYKPFEKEQKATILSGEYNGEMAKIRAMVDSRQISWDVVQVETGDLYRGCSEGLFEQLDWSKMNLKKTDYLEGALSECGASFFMWSEVLAYDRTKFANDPPNSWQDFWNVKKYPGKRALRKSPILALEAALLADGVKPTDIYQVLSTPEGVDRAFHKLDELKPYIQWWDTGAQPMQWLISGDVVMTSAYNGRIYAAQNEGKSVGIVWNDSFYDIEGFAIIKGTPHKELAERFIALTMQAKNQIPYSKAGYGFSNKQTANLLDTNILNRLSTSPEHMKNAHRLDPDFWIDNGEVLQQRFNVWAAE